MIEHMMDRQLMISSLIEHAAQTYSDQEVVSRTCEGTIHRYGYAEALSRIKRLANMLKDYGVGEGDRVATVAWNTHRHFELYYAVSSIGAICHTINPRLGPQQVGYVLNHAEDKLVFFDITFTPLLAALREHAPTVERYIVMTDAAHAPADFPGGALVYEDELAARSDSFEWPIFDERTACGLCYTSGTTGDPKGVVYTHRSTVLMAYAGNSPEYVGLSSRDCVLPVVPMFHVNAWGVPYSAPMCGAKLVFPGPGMDGASLHEMMDKEKVTISLGVPTVWLNLLAYLEQSGARLDHMKMTLVGGAALSEQILRAFEEKYDVRVAQGWGMTEMSPLGTVNRPPAEREDLDDPAVLARRLKQGRCVPGVEMRIVSEAGKVLPWDGQSVGHLQVRGPWITGAYFRHPGDTLTADGWFDTGDVANIDPDGFMQITDRSKDVIKSGGEWISTIDIENAAMSHPDVAHAAVIAAQHPKWQERPLLLVVRRKGADPMAEDVRLFVKERVSRLAEPDAVEFIDEMPLGATGKVLKTELRKMFADYLLSA
ncbi:MAG: long-chain fatty acid--CoA ligase [Pseudomonadota bacterium]